MLPTSWRTAWVHYSAPVFAFATCVAHHESWSAGLWRAQNGHSSASGFAQWVNETWAVNAARAGFSGPYRAADAPPSEQVAVFAWMFDHGEQGAWAGAGCGYGT